MRDKQSPTDTSTAVGTVRARGAVAVLLAHAVLHRRLAVYGRYARHWVVDCHAAAPARGHGDLHIKHVITRKYEFLIAAL